MIDPAHVAGAVALLIYLTHPASMSERRSAAYISWGIVSTVLVIGVLVFWLSAPLCPACPDPLPPVDVESFR